MKIKILITSINLYLFNLPILYPLKTQENQRISGVFREYKYICPFFNIVHQRVKQFAPSFNSFMTEVPIIQKPVHQWTGFYMTWTSLMKQLSKYLLKVNKSGGKTCLQHPLNGTHLVAVRGLIYQAVSTRAHQRGELN